MEEKIYTLTQKELENLIHETTYNTINKLNKKIRNLEEEKLKLEIYINENLRDKDTINENITILFRWLSEKE
jgi:hypothetical protein